MTRLLELAHMFGGARLLAGRGTKCIFFEVFSWRGWGMLTFLELAHATQVLHKLFRGIGADAHRLRILYVGPQNRHFEKEMEEAKARWTHQWPRKPFPKYWEPHLRVVGLKMQSASDQLRSGKAVVKILPFKLVPPGASPPQESSVEVNNSGIMNQIRTSRNVRLYSDGARCWPAMCKAHAIRNFHVKHNKFEFAKKLPDVKRPKKGVVAGTQCIDRMWASLDKFIPPELSNKSGKGGTVNEKKSSLTSMLGYDATTCPPRQTSKWNCTKIC